MTSLFFSFPIWTKVSKLLSDFSSKMAKKNYRASLVLNPLLMRWGISSPLSLSPPSLPLSSSLSSLSLYFKLMDWAMPVSDRSGLEHLEPASSAWFNHPCRLIGSVSGGKNLIWRMQVPGHTFTLEDFILCFLTLSYGGWCLILGSLGGWVNVKNKGACARSENAGLCIRKLAHVLHGYCHSEVS